MAFETNGPLTSGFTHTPGSANVIVAATGVYKIDFSTQTTQPSQFTVFDNGTPIPGTSYGSFGGSQLNHGEVIVSLTAGDDVTLVNHTSLTAVDLQTDTGGTTPVINAALDLERLS
ncbi:hypothetical protein KDK_09140 [Dictyobacter kobayashii]|uniref:BclA C-terminal domain-containing protein n=1 Tax=Dictyobacter kobayashii TaxID=2014872 RepID=A0A402ADD8_9CHLR|nr:hypothetical protein KDK_09140 [Dictyobacter kobayashii]